MKKIALAARNKKHILIIIGVFLMMSYYPSITMQNETSVLGNDKTLSPYFMIETDGDLENFPLLSTTADVRISGVIADVTVKQTYKNNGKKTIEAIYVFPASTRAAVYSMEMKIGDRILKAVVQEREKARQTYEDAKKEGRSASLLEQERPNVFQMNVANILPGDLIEIELKYTELLIPESGLYQFVYPTVVGPRYSNKKLEDAKENDKYVNSPYQHSGDKPKYKFDISLQIDAGMKIEEISSESHIIKYEFMNEDNSRAKIKIEDSEQDKGNKDFILSYRLSGDKIKTGLLVSKLSNDKDSKIRENHFLLMLQPPRRVEQRDLTLREYIFIVDVSGSMYGFPLDISKRLMRDLLNNLNEKDKFNILLFSGSSSFLSDVSLNATKENIEKGISFINKEYGYGGTELLPAMKKALSYPKSEGYSRSFLVITDGYIDVEIETFELIRKNLSNANLFAFGIGSSVNRFLIEGMARAGMSEPFVLTSPQNSNQVTEKFFNYVKSPVMTDIKIEFNGFKTYDVEPISIPDVMAERPIIIYGKWKDELKGEIRVKGKSGSTELMVTIPVEQFSEVVEGNALAYIWARNKIQMLGDYENVRASKEREKEIIELGLNYNLLTNYTSFVAEDYVKRADGKYEVVKQPLPMPEGVSDFAVGGGLMSSGAMHFKVAAPMSIDGSILSRGNGYETQIAFEIMDDEEYFSIDNVSKKPNFDTETFKKDVEKLIAEHQKNDFTTKIIVKISSEGVVEETENKNINPDSFENEVEKLIKSLVFMPASINGANVPSVFTIVIMQRKGKLRIDIRS
ncbi:MAG: VIT domain-containing protein [Candidatus Kapabacteria bacterium]|nr:VIT domain-containing protein [Candidatus Kapabacteria bacterium]